MERILIGIGIDRHCRDAHFAAGLDHAGGDLAAIGGEDFREKPLDPHPSLRSFADSSNLEMMGFARSTRRSGMRTRTVARYSSFPPRSIIKAPRTGIPFSRNHQVVPMQLAKAGVTNSTKRSA